MQRIHIAIPAITFDQICTYTVARAHELLTYSVPREDRPIAYDGPDPIRYRNITTEELHAFNRNVLPFFHSAS